MLKVSIVTPVLNQVATLEATILSVLEQDYPHLEYLIQDGGSTDGTLDILRQYEDRLSWVSEPDNGQSEAINRGFARASGNILGWLNADDLYLPGAIRTVVTFFELNPAAQLVYGDALAVDYAGRAFGRRANVAPCDFRQLVDIGDFIVQPAAFWRANVISEVGGLDETLHYVMDYEFWMRIAQRYPLHYLPGLLAKERMHALAKTFDGTLMRLEELQAIAQRYGRTTPPHNFRAETATGYLCHALGQLRRGQWHEARAFWQHVRSIRPPVPKFVLHFSARLLFGDQGTVWLRLVSNWLRTHSKPV